MSETSAADMIGKNSTRIDEKFRVTYHMTPSSMEGVSYMMDLARFGVKLSHFSITFAVRNIKGDLARAAVSVLISGHELPCSCTFFVAAYQSKEERDAALRKAVLSAIAANVLALNMELINMEMEEGSTRDERTKNKLHTKLLERVAKFLSL